MTTDLSSYIHMISRSQGHFTYTESIVVETTNNRIEYSNVILEPTGIWIMPVNTTSSFLSSTLGAPFSSHRHHHHRQESVPHETKEYRTRSLTTAMIQNAGHDMLYLSWENILRLEKGPSGHSEHIFAKGVAHHTHPITLSIRTTPTVASTILPFSSSSTVNLSDATTTIPNVSNDTINLSGTVNTNVPTTPLSLFTPPPPTTGTVTTHSCSSSENLTLWVYQIPSSLFEQITRLRQIYALRNLLAYIMPEEFTKSSHSDPFMGTISNTVTSSSFASATPTVTASTVEKSIHQLNQILDEIRPLLHQSYTPIHQYFNPVTISALVMQHMNQFSTNSNNNSLPSSSSFIFAETDLFSSSMASLRSGARHIDIFAENILLHRMYRQLFFRSSLVIHLLSLAEECIIMITLTTKMVKDLRKTFRYIGGNELRTVSNSTTSSNDGTLPMTTADTKYIILCRIYGEKLRLILGLQVGRIILLRSIVSLLQVAAFDSEGLDDRTILCNPRPLNLLRFVNLLIFDVLSSHLNPELYVPPHASSSEPVSSSSLSLSPRFGDTTENNNVSAGPPSSSKTTTGGPLTRLVRNNRRHKDTHPNALNQGVHPLSYEHTSHTFGIGPPSIHDVHKTSSVPPFCYTPYDTGSIDIKAALSEASKTVSRTRLDYARKIDDDRIRQEDLRKQEKLRQKQEYINRYGDEDGFEESYQQKQQMVPLFTGNSSSRNVVMNEIKIYEGTVQPLYYSRPRTPELLGLSHVLRSSPNNEIIGKERKRNDNEGYIPSTLYDSTVPWMGDDVVVPLKRNAEPVLSVKLNRRTSNEGLQRSISAFSEGEGFRVSTTDRTRTQTSLDSRNYTEATNDPMSPLPIVEDEDAQSTVSLVAASDDENDDDEFLIPDQEENDNLFLPSLPTEEDETLGETRVTTVNNNESNLPTNKMLTKLRKMYGIHGLDDTAIAYILEGRQAGKDLRDASVALIGDIIHMVIEYNKVHDQNQRNTQPYRTAQSNHHRNHSSFSHGTTDSLGRLAVTVRYGDEPNLFAQNIDNVTVVPFSSSQFTIGSSSIYDVRRNDRTTDTKSNSSGGKNDTNFVSTTRVPREEDSEDSDTSENDENRPTNGNANLNGTYGSTSAPIKKSSRSVTFKSSRSKTLSSSSSTFPSAVGIIPTNPLANKNLTVIDTLSLLPSYHVMKYLKYIAQEIRRLLSIADKAKNVWLSSQRNPCTADTSLLLLSPPSVRNGTKALSSSSYRFTLQPYENSNDNNDDLEAGTVHSTHNRSDGAPGIVWASIPDSVQLPIVPTVQSTTETLLPLPLSVPKSSSISSVASDIGNTSTLNTTFSSASIIPSAKPSWSTFTKSIRSVFSSSKKLSTTNNVVPTTPSPSPAVVSALSGSLTATTTPFIPNNPQMIISNSGKSVTENLQRYTDRYHDKVWKLAYTLASSSSLGLDKISSSINRTINMQNDYRLQYLYRNPIYAVRLFTHVQTLYSLLHTSSSLSLTSDPGGHSDASLVNTATGQFRNSIITMLRIQLRHFISHGRLVHIFHYEHIIFAEIIRMLDEIRQML